MTRMSRLTPIAASAASLLLVVCAREPAQFQTDTSAPRMLERAGQPVDPLKTIGHFTAACMGILTDRVVATR